MVGRAREEAERLLDSFDIQDSTLADAIAEALSEARYETLDRVRRQIETRINVLRLRMGEADSGKRSWIGNAINTLEEILEDM
jgi:hypothetical protein